MTVALSALVAGSAALIAGAIGLNALDRAPKVDVDLASFSWLGQVHVTLKTAENLPALAPIPELRELHDAKTRPLRHLSLRKFATVKPAVVAQAAAPAAPLTVDLRTEAQKLQDLHRLLQHRFLLSFEVQKPKLDIQVASAAPTHSTPSVVPTRKLNTHADTRRILAPVIAAQPPVVVPRPLVVPAVAVDQIRTSRAAPELSTEKDAKLQMVSAIPVIPAPVVALPKQPAPVISRPAAPPLAATPPPAPMAATAEAPPAAPPIPTLAQLTAEFAAPAPKAVPTHSVPPAPMPAMDIQVVEAFDWNTQITSANIEYLTHEANDAGWRVAHADIHWPTMILEKGAAVPLVSFNAAKVLAVKAHTSLQGDAGIVFGKLPAGMTVELSGRAERAVVLNRQNMDAQPTDTERYFAFLNAAPGAQLLFLTRTGVPTEGGTIGIPVLAGTATYVDLSQVVRRQVRGRVLDGSSADGHPLKRVQVRVVGQAGAAAITGDTGTFTIGDVYSVPGHPIYLETETGTGFTHRYSVNPEKADDVLLFRMNQHQIQDWLSQLDGGISADSGLVVAALPELTAANGDGKLFPLARSLSSSPTLSPESYTLSASGQLMVASPLQASSSRFVSLQLPEGPAIVGVEDRGQRVTWSELTMVSPGVVNVIGPY
jgi:hypothetical protein